MSPQDGSCQKITKLSICTTFVEDIQRIMRPLFRTRRIFFFHVFSHLAILATSMLNKHSVRNHHRRHRNRADERLQNAKCTLLLFCYLGRYEKL